MKTIEDKTRVGTRNCITFKKRTNEINRNFLKIIDEVGCYSLIGLLKEERGQIVSLEGNYCLNKATILHTLVHALGFDHEHNRSIN
jgi:hypothetical protein